MMSHQGYFNVLFTVAHFFKETKKEPLRSANPDLWWKSKNKPRKSKDPMYGGAVIQRDPL